MRISDWSSDVCSSDLIHDLLMALPPSSSVSITRPDELAKELFTHRGSGTLVRRGEKIRRYGSWTRIDPIGRASCRERVCQYVLISVVAESLKKKITKLI